MNHDEYIIRIATNRDLRQIAHLVKKCLAEYNFEYEPETSEKDLQNIETSYTHSGGTFVVVETKEGKIIGTIAIAKANDGIAKLRKMYVNKSYRGKGLGKMLLDRIIIEAKELQYNVIILETVHTMKPAIYLYEKFGFKKVKNGKPDSPRCDVVMKRSVLL